MRALLVAALLLHPASARADLDEAATGVPVDAPPTEAPAAPPPPAVGASEDDGLLRLSLNGFARSRSLLTKLDTTAGLYGLAPVPSTSRAQLELELQPKLAVGERLHVTGDLSFVESSDAPHHLALVNELYVDARIAGPLRVLVGRYRLIWGSGVAVNPTDLLNPPKDPLALDLQRTGALLLPMLEVSLGNFAVSAYASPRLATNSWALPDDVAFDSTIFGARLYALLGGFDVNLTAHRDQARDRNYAGVSASGFLGTVVELHVEALGRLGASDVPAVPQFPGCGAPLAPAWSSASVRGVAGSRLHFHDESIATIEYLFDADSLNGAAFDQFVAQLPCVKSAVPVPPAPANPIGYPVEPLLLVRPHHVFLGYMRPHLTKDRFESIAWTSSLIVTPEDPSVVVQSDLTYDLGDRAALRLRGAYWLGRANTEAGLWPRRGLGVLELRIAL